MKRRYFIRAGGASDWMEVTRRCFHDACVRFAKAREVGTLDLWEGWGFCVREGVTAAETFPTKNA